MLTGPFGGKSLNHRFPHALQPDYWILEQRLQFNGIDLCICRFGRTVILTKEGGFAR